ncbi:hypothetical protein [Selenomonas ruminis]|uniref:Uncharacterized protein n=1 Tax=Selenomonas ruminis TaxID=2593411 RepID=A0A5D6W4H2_9FIRM|nr:hypothetical protein [Selenomonas sp. mPRGC5]TYZ23331.1 hypothetical protein FZ040_05465 [Selenomonas sp. mPRGC5]
MSLLTIMLFLACPLLVFAVGGIFLRRRRYPLAALAVLLGVVAAVIGGINGFHEMKAQVVHEYSQELDGEYKAALAKKYQQALSILQGLSFTKPDPEQIDKALELLHDFDSAQIAEKMADDCPNADALITYAKAMKQVSTYGGHMTNMNVNENTELQKLVASFPENYNGVLQDKIIPFRRLIIGMEKEAKKQAKLDAENAASHKQSMKEGQYGNIRPGDPEEKISAAMGQPDHVNSSKTSDGEIKQYVFNHNGKNFYVYTKNGVVTEVR